MEIGEKLSPILAEIEATLWEHEAYVKTPPMFTDDGFRAACKIFMAVMLDKSFVIMKDESMNIETAEAMAKKMGEDLHRIIKVYTGVDTHKLYSK